MCIENNCNNKVNKRYNGYCYKHRRKYLINEITNTIKIDTFTNKMSDYLKKDIILTLWNYQNKDTAKWKGKREYINNMNLKTKGEVFDLLLNVYNILKKYNNDIDIIVKLQKLIKGKPSKIDKLRGVGFINKKLCNNDTDFFTYDNINEINDRYFYSYKDDNNFIWFFDIRSFQKLIEMEQNNQYTREELPIESIERSKKLIQLIQLNASDELDQNDYYKDRSQVIRQKIIDLFSQIEQYGYECNINWFTSLNMVKLKKLYRSLEDIWNYRLQLDQETKNRLCPPNGLIYNIPVHEVFNMNNKENIQELIMNETLKFNNASIQEDRKLGHMYFLIGLGTISIDCYNAHMSWMMHLH